MARLKFYPQDPEIDWFVEGVKSGPCTPVPRETATLLSLIHKYETRELKAFYLVFPGERSALPGNF